MPPKRTVSAYTRPSGSHRRRNGITRARHRVGASSPHGALCLLLISTPLWGGVAAARPSLGHAPLLTIRGPAATVGALPQSSTRDAVVIDQSPELGYRRSPAGASAVTMEPYSAIAAVAPSDIAGPRCR
jgi:hypothetical protein